MDNREASIPFAFWRFLHPRYIGPWFTLFVLRLLALLPYSALLGIGRALGRFIVWSGISRAHIMDINLRLCFPDKSDDERAEIRGLSYQNIAISLMETAMCWWWSDRRLRRLVTIEGLEHVHEALKLGKGVILVTGHFTSLEIGGRLFSLYAPLQAMYRTQPNKLFDSFLTMQRERYLTQMIPRQRTRQLLRGLKANLPTWYAPDQNFTRERNVFAPFMGIPAATIVAGARIAKVSGAPMLPFFPQRNEDGSGYTLIIDPPLENFPCGDDLQDATRINQSIEKYLYQYPSQYIWSHKRFKNRPEGEADLYRQS
ncbi:MAG TPA: LpxL/LpxP family Kdo(2)-lipid IV(A) lauroyl/palmitoleoyl acyltransferase [Chromatiales bacterium]|nr:LpxL/LpxP family Kdo(2)-lipid IV(A) lauroyl/palmitoleoyl acyltransferase [Chromatiales bacterium]